MSAEEHFVGRQEGITRLQAALTGELRARGPLTIQSIEGPGGIGKSYLFAHVLARADLGEQYYLRLTLDGNDPASDSLITALGRIVDSADAPALRDKPAGYYFPTVKRVLQTIVDIKNEAGAEFLKQHPDAKAGQAALFRLLDQTFAAGKRLNDVSPVTKKRVNFRELEKWRPLLEASVPLLHSLREEHGRVLERLGLRKATAQRNAIKENACRELAEALVSDLTAILAGYRRKDVLKASHKKLPDTHKLLLVLDDYEKLQEPLEEFLVGYLLPVLQTASFPSLIILLGRDQLQATHPAWDQHLAPSLLKPLVLAPLSRNEMDALVASYGVTNSGDRERAWRDTQGYPFYVQLWIEEAESGGSGALRLKRFYDRATRWMTEQEKYWLEATLFLDDVNKRSLRRMLDDTEDANAAFEWFIRDGSVRDTEGETFRVREYLRSRLRDYLRKSDPERYEVLEQKAIRAVRKDV